METSVTPVKDLNKAFSTMQLVALASAVLSTIVVVAAGFLVWYAFNVSGQRVYVVGNQGSFAALGTSAEEHTAFEARNLVRTFMTTMFSHDQYSFKQHLDLALPLIDDAGGRRIYEGFKKSDVFANYVRYGARATLSVDSVALHLERRPYTGTVYTRQRIFIGDQQSKSLPLAARFTLIETNRSEANPFGLLLSNFDYIPYNPPVSEEERKLLAQQAAERTAQQAEAARQNGIATPAQ